MPERLLQFIPFIALAGTRPTLNISRIIEGLIIGAVIGVLMSYIALQVLEAKMDYMIMEIQENKAEIKEVKYDVRDMRTDLYRPAHE